MEKQIDFNGYSLSLINDFHLSQYLSPYLTTFDHRFLAIFSVGNINILHLTHFNLNSQILKIQYTSGFLNGFGMLSDRELVNANFSNKTIEILAFYPFKFSSMKHQYWSQRKQQISIFTFPGTNLFCIVEKNEYQFRLTYYTYQGISNSNHSIQVAQWYSQEQENLPIIRKLNNHSKVGWWQQQTFGPASKLILNSFDLSQNFHGQLLKFETINCFNSWFDQSQDLFVNIQSTWETEKDKYLINGRFERRRFQRTYNIFRKSFILDVSNKHDQGVLKKTHFCYKDACFDLEPLQITKIQDLGCLTVFYIQDQQQQLENNMVRIICVNNQLQEVMLIERVSHTQRVCYCYFSTDLDDSLLIKARCQWKRGYPYRKFDVALVSCVPSVKSIYLQFLLHFNQDFDDDLLQDCMSLLVDS